MQKFFRQPTTILLMLMTLWLIFSQIIVALSDAVSTQLLSVVMVALMIVYLVVSLYTPHDDAK